MARGGTGVAPVGVDCIIITLPGKSLTGGGHFTFKILNISKHLFNMLSIVVHRYPTMRDTFATHSRHIVDTFLTLLRHICYASAPLRCGVAVCCV